MSITSWFPVRRLLTPMLSKKCWKLGTIKSFWKLSKENGVFFRVKQIELNLVMFIPFHSEQNYVMLISRNFQNRKKKQKFSDRFCFLRRKEIIKKTSSNVSGQMSSVTRSGDRDNLSPKLLSTLDYVMMALWVISDESFVFLLVFTIW